MKKRKKFKKKSCYSETLKFNAYQIEIESNRIETKSIESKRTESNRNQSNRIPSTH